MEKRTNLITKRGKSPLESENSANNAVDLAGLMKEELQPTPVVEQPISYQSEPVSRQVARPTTTKSRKSQVKDDDFDYRKIKYTATMDRDVWTDAKIAAFDNNVSFSKFVELAVSQYLSTRRKR